MKKYTGWKVPAVFCATAALVVCTVSLWRHWNTPPVPPLEPALLEQARTLLIDLEKDEEGREFKRRISNDGTALGTREQKDARLAILADDAVRRRRYDAACAATILVYNDFNRDAVFSKVAQRAAESCADLPWGAFATKGFSHKDAQAAAHLMLNERFAECRRSTATSDKQQASQQTTNHAQPPASSQTPQQAVPARP